MQPQHSARASKQIAAMAMIAVVSTRSDGDGGDRRMAVALDRITFLDGERIRLETMTVEDFDRATRYVDGDGSGVGHVDYKYNTYRSGGG